jgi:hypothetical protein
VAVPVKEKNCYTAKTHDNIFRFPETQNTIFIMEDGMLAFQIVNYNINSNDLGPMPPIGTDLSHEKLTIQQRIWLGRQVVDNNNGPSNLGRAWNLDRRRVWLFANQYRLRKIPADRGGRPRVLDDVSLAGLQSLVRDQGIRDRLVLSGECDLEYNYTNIRRNIAAFGEEGNDGVVLEMSGRSKRRYISSLL